MSVFNDNILKAIRNDLETGRLPLNRVSIIDDMVPELRAFIYANRDTEFWRGTTFFGAYPKTSIKDARNAAGAN